MWNRLIKEEKEKEYFKNLEERLEKTTTTIYPPKEDIFKAYELCPYESVKVVILGQDPYHQPHQAMGLSFSVNEGIKLPPSLVNIYKELESDCGINKLTGDLSGWATQGVFLLNTLLTVEDSTPLAHKDWGWEIFTDETIKRLSERKKPMIFVLWGKNAQDKIPLIREHHVILKAPHPSPLSAYRGFHGSKPFSQINEILKDWGEAPIDWSL